MTTLTLQIGNTDNKLSQQEWHNFVNEVEKTLFGLGVLQCHFNGDSPGRAPWQNHCWVVDIHWETRERMFREFMTRILAEYRQDSMAITLGITEFLRPQVLDQPNLPVGMVGTNSPTLSSEIPV
jgi:hypothetical protein